MIPRITKWLLCFAETRVLCFSPQRAVCKHGASRGQDVLPRTTLTLQGSNHTLRFRGPGSSSQVTRHELFEDAVIYFFALVPVQGFNSLARGSQGPGSIRLTGMQMKRVDIHVKESSEFSVGTAFVRENECNYEGLVSGEFFIICYEHWTHSVFKFRQNQ